MIMVMLMIDEFCFYLTDRKWQSQNMHNTKQAPTKIPYR